MDETVKAVAVTCNHCGAALDVPAATRFVTCTYCGTRLEVHRSGGAAFTEILQSIDQRTGQIAEDVEQIRRQNDLEQIDREWAMRREQLMVTTKHGGRTAPSRIASVFAIAVALVFGSLWLKAGSHGAPGAMILFGLLVVGGIIVSAAFTFFKAGDFEQAERDYHRRRDEILRKMNDDG